MKDSVGSTVLMKIFVVFMVVYIILMASILNYTKTFRIKNQIINIINRQGGYNASARQEIADYIEKSSMYMECTLLEGSNDFGSDPNNKKCEIKEYVVEDAAGGRYYKVKVYVTFQFPLIKQTLQIPITGETKRLFDAESDPNPPKYVIINSEYNPVSDKVGLKVENSSCGGGGNGCCQSSICPGSRLIGDGKGGCTCENGGTPTYDSAKRGRKPYPSAGNACAWCWTCEATPVTINVTGESTSWATRRSLRINITDTSHAGFTCGTYGENSSIAVDYDSAVDGTVSTKAIKCSIVGNGPDTTKSYNVYVRKASTVPDGPCANCACKTKPACPVGECTRCNTSKNEWTTCKPCLFEN